MDVMTFKWRDYAPLMFPNDSGTAFFRLPKYVVSYNLSNSDHHVNYGDGERINFPAQDRMND